MSSTYETDASPIHNFFFSLHFILLNSRIPETHTNDASFSKSIISKAPVGNLKVK